MPYTLRVRQHGLLLAMVAALVVPLGSAALPATQRLSAQQPDVVHSQVVPGRSRPADLSQGANPSAFTPIVKWPKAGVASVNAVAMSAAEARVATSKGELTKAGDLPVWVGPGSSGQNAGKVEVSLLDRQAVPQVWRDGLVFRVTGTAADATVGVDYSGFANAYGGDWAGRLRMIALPECALTTPEAASCGPAELPSRNNLGAKRVTAQLTGKSGGLELASAGAAGGMLMALAAGPSSATGDYSATGLNASATWSAGGSTGDFTWNYPMKAAPGLGGPEPAMSLAYSSSAVDGKSEATNNQPSWLGQGFEYWPGYIERRYKSCTDDMGGNANNTVKTGDLCWGTDNAVLNLNGSGAEMVRDDTTGVWKPKSDDGSKIERLEGTVNGAWNNEYWKVTTSDGTQYFFGLNRLPGWTSGKATTESAWLAPVAGNNTGERCRQTLFKDSFCTQAWRWNLDYVVDPHGNTMSYWYTKHTNKYARNLVASDAVSYDRGGKLDRIAYGTDKRSGTDSVYSAVKAPAQVLFESADRCVTTACGTHDEPNWPDTPWDQECTGTTCDDYSPTFWSTVRLKKITTQVVKGGNYSDVDSWEFTHQFPPTGSGTPKGLWLESVKRTGLVGTALALPEVNFDWVALENRVDTYNGTKPTMNWHRMSTIWTETGGKISIRYSDKDCVPGTRMPSAPHTNTLRCYPVLSEEDGGPKTDYFHKYLVTEVTEADFTGGGTDKITSYEYPGTPAWRFTDDDGLTKDKFRTWSEYRGYDRVLVREGAPGNQTLAETYFLRGMHGSKDTPSGGTRNVVSTAAIGASVNDENAFAGMVRQQTIYNGALTDPVSRTVNVPWQSGPTATRGSVTARFKGTQTEFASILVKGTPDYWRTTKKQTVLDTYGMPSTVTDHGIVSADGLTEVSGDETCTANTYQRDLGTNQLTLISRVQTFALACGQAAVSEGDIVGDVKTTFGTNGDISKVEHLEAWTPGGGSVFVQESRHTYDVYGRELQKWDARDLLTTTAYTPITGGPVTAVSKTDALGTSTEELDPAWGSPLVKTDVNSKRTEVVYDGLGRLIKVWLANRLRSANPTSPNTEYDYLIRNTGGVNAITTRKLNAAGNYVTSYNLFDGLLRERQTQMASNAGGGTVFTEKIYDAAGRVAIENSGHYDPAVTPSSTLRTILAWENRAQTVTEFDGAGRATATIKKSAGAELWRTSVSYGGDRVYTTPPAGGIPTTSITDSGGHVVELRQHSGGSTTGPFDATTYFYNRKNQLEKVTDAAGNFWNYTYDLQGHKKTVEDPDKGLTTTNYNSVGDVLDTTDANSVKLVYEYDTLGRKIGLYDNAIAAANKQASWAYDPAGAKGQLASSSRWAGTNRADEYKTKIRGYTPLYASTGEDYIIPAAESGLAGTYTFTRSYKVDGSLSTLGYPNAGGLGGETLTFTYDSVTGMPEQVQTNWPGAGQYVTNTDQTAFGETAFVQYQMTAGNWLQRSYVYDDATRRLVQQTAIRQIAPQTLSDVHTDFDAADNITKIADGADSQCFRYDHLRRLTEAWTPSSANCAVNPAVSSLGGPAPYWHSWAISNIGNRLSEARHATGGDTVVTSGYAGKPHAATSAGTKNYAFDNAGNMTCRPVPGAASNTCQGANSQTLSWDGEGKLSTVSDGSSYLYDASGSRLIARDSGGKTLYLLNTELRYTAAAGLKATRYYAHASNTMAMRTVDNGLTWLVGDHHGTQSIAVASGNQVVTQRRETPYGDARGTAAAWPNEKGFVGGDKDPTGLTNIGARLYDPAGGRFISVDPVIDFNDPQQLNAYAYSNNSPITMSDPDGLRYLLEDDDEPQIIYPGGGPHEGKNRFDHDLPIIRGSTDRGRDLIWRRYLSMTTADIDAESGEVNQTGPWALFDQFKDGYGPKNQQFFQVDNMTKGIRSSDHMVKVRQQLADQLSNGTYPKDGYGQNDFDLPDGEAAAVWVARDIAGSLKDFVDGDINENVKAMVGSFKLDYEIMAIDPKSGKAVVAFHGFNQTDTKSMLRNPLAPKPSGGNSGPSSGAWSPKTQEFFWTEVITFPVVTPGAGTPPSGPR